MKKSYILLVLGIISVVFYAINCTNKSIKIPAGEQEENPYERAEWDRMRLADPVTGAIPIGINWLEQEFSAGISTAVRDRDAGGDWVSRGPWNVGGRTRALAIDVVNPDHIFAGGVSGGIWESSNGGQSWQRRTPLNAHPGIISIAQDTRSGKTNNWYYISGEITGTSASGGSAFYLGDGMFKSTDNGLTWSPITSTAAGNPVQFTDVWQGGWRVVTDPTAPAGSDILYAATYGTIWRSVNGGTVWTAVRGGQSSNPASYYTDVTITSTGVLYATMSSEGTQKGIWRSTNGTTWTNILPTTGFPATYDRFVIGVNPNDENEVYFLGATPGSGHYNNYVGSDDWTSLWKYKYISDNGSGAGGEWSNLSLNLPATGTEFDQFSAQGGYDLVVRVQPGTNNVFVGGTSIYRSTDGFASPNNTTHIAGYKPGTFLPFFELYPNHHPDQHDILFHPTNPNIMITASDGGLHRTEDCNASVVEWSYLNDGYRTSQFYSAIIEKATPNDSTLIGGLQDNGNFFVNSTNPTAKWKQTVNGDGAFGAIPDGKPYYILSIQKGRLVKCNIDNQGNVNGFRRFDPVGPNKDDYMFINPLAMDPTDQKILYLPAGRHLYRQNDLNTIAVNNEWDSISQGWTKFPDTLAAINDNNAEHKFSAMAVTKTHRLYMGTTRGKLFRMDGADTGSPVMTPLLGANGSNTAYVSCIAVDPDNPDFVIAVYSNYNTYSIYMSSNGGTSWKKAAGNLEANLSGTGNGSSIRWISILPFADGTRKYFCGTSTGLFSTNELKEHIVGAGTVWVKESEDLIGSTVINHIEVRPSDGLVVVATHGTGMYSANFTTSVSNQEPTTSVKVQVWPNPARDYAHISWSNNDAQVQANLYDNNGRLVVNTSLAGGTGQIPLRDLSKGIYYYEIVGKGWTKTGKLVHE